MACRKFNKPLDPADEKSISTDEQRSGSCLDQAHEGGVDFAVVAWSAVKNPISDGFELGG